MTDLATTAAVPAPVTPATDRLHPRLHQRQHPPRLPRRRMSKATKVLDQVIDIITRHIVDGHTDPRDYTDKFRAAWRKYREKTIERMIVAASGPEAIEVRRLRREQE